MTTTPLGTLWIGTYPPDGAGAPRGSGEGLWLVEDAGAAREVTPVPAPSFLALHPGGSRLYAVAEDGDGALAVFDVAAAGDARPLATVPSGGVAPCHVAVHPDGGWAYVANYGDGVALAVALDASGDPTGDVVALPHSGSGPRADRQEGPHAHSCTIAPGATHLLVADLGTDELRAYALDATGRPATESVLSALPAGTGPRHVAVLAESGTVLLLVSLELSDEVAVLSWDAETGRAEVLSRVPTTARTPGAGGPPSYPSHVDVTLRADGTALVDVGVRGADVVSTFALHRDAVPRLELLGECPTATWPRHFATLAGGDVVVVAGERAHTLAVHERGASGVLRPAERRVDLPSPACVVPASPQRASSVVENE